MTKLLDLAGRLRNLSRIMAGGDGTTRIDTPAWRRVEEIAEELECLACANKPIPYTVTEAGRKAVGGGE